ALSPTGDVIASSSGDETVRIWDLAKGTAIAVLEEHNSTGLSVSFSPDGALLASLAVNGIGARQNNLIMWHCRDWSLAASYSHPTEGAFRGGMAFHPSQPLLAVKNSQFSSVDCYRIESSLPGDNAAGIQTRRYG